MDQGVSNKHFKTVAKWSMSSEEIVLSGVPQELFQTWTER